MQEPDGQTFETHRLLSLRGVYRGLLDTGIQVLNTDSEILFIGANDPMYDRVGQNVFPQDETYRHAVYSVGSQTDPADATDQTVTGTRWNGGLPLPLVQVRKSSNETADTLWGRTTTITSSRATWIWTAERRRQPSVAMVLPHYR